MRRSKGKLTAVWIGLILGLLAFPASAQALDLREGMEQLAAQLGGSVPEGRTVRIAVTDFPDLQGVTSNLGRHIAERLTTRLSVQSQKFRVIERRRLNLVLGELRFSMSDLVDPNKAKELGRMLGVEALVVGSLSDLGNVVDVDARIIEIETNNVLPGVTTTISKDQTVARMLGEALEVPPRPSDTEVPPRPSTSVPPPPPPGRYQEFQKFRVAVERLQVGRRGDIPTVTVFLGYMNKTREELLIGLCRAPGYEGRSRVGDDVGNEYMFVSSSGMDDACTAFGPQSALTVAPGMTGSASLYFMKQTTGNAGNKFSFTSEQVILRRAADGRLQLESKHNISILDMLRK